MNLYELSGELKSVIHQMETFAEENGGTLDGFPMADYLEAIKDDFDRKALSIACVIKDLEADAAKHAEEMRSQADKKRSCERKAESLRQYLIANIEPGVKFEDQRAKIGWRKSEGVKLSCPVMDLPEEYIRFKEPEPRLDELKKAVKSGVVIDGVELETKQNIQIK